jgi:hypothetical protein
MHEGAGILRRGVEWGMGVQKTAFLKNVGCVSDAASNVGVPAADPGAREMPCADARFGSRAVKSISSQRVRA